MNSTLPACTGGRCRTCLGWPRAHPLDLGATSGRPRRHVASAAPARTNATPIRYEHCDMLTNHALRSIQPPVVGRSSGRSRAAAAAAAAASSPGAISGDLTPDGATAASGAAPPQATTASVTSTVVAASASATASAPSTASAAAAAAAPAPAAAAASGAAATPAPAAPAGVPWSGPAAEPRLDLASARHFVNLTNGIEALPMLQQLGLNYSFVRIQSTACEQQNLELLMTELDAHLLLNLALGHTCIVYDCGSRRRDGTPRALWYGLEFVRYCLTQLWKLPPCPALLRGRNVARTFDAHIRGFKQSTLKRIKYYTKYLPPAAAAAPTMENAAAGAAAAAAAAVASGGPPGGGGLRRLRLHGAFRATDHDDDVAFYVALLHGRELLLGSGGLGGGGGGGGGVGAGRAGGGAGGGGGGPGTPGLQQQQQQLLLPGSLAPAAVAMAAAVGADGSGSSFGGGAVLQGLQQGPGAGLGSGAGLGLGLLDGEAVLAAHGFSLFRRGLSPAEWAAAAAAAAAATAAAEAEEEAEEQAGTNSGGNGVTGTL